MKFLAIAGGWALVLFGTAMGAIVIEGLVHRHRMRREAMLHRRMGLGIRGNGAPRD